MHAFLRDAEGILTLILRENIDLPSRRRLEADIAEQLGPYAAKYPIATPRDVFDPRLADNTRDQLEPVPLTDGYKFVRLIERRLVGQDWYVGFSLPFRMYRP